LINKVVANPWCLKYCIYTNCRITKFSFVFLILFFKFIYLFNDNLATRGGLTDAILSCHVELSKYNNAILFYVNLRSVFLPFGVFSLLLPLFFRSLNCKNLWINCPQTSHMRTGCHSDDVSMFRHRLELVGSGWAARDLWWKRNRIIVVRGKPHKCGGPQTELPAVGVRSQRQGTSCVGWLLLPSTPGYCVWGVNFTHGGCWVLATRWEIIVQWTAIRPPVHIRLPPSNTCAYIGWFAEAILLPSQLSYKTWQWKKS